MERIMANRPFKQFTGLFEFAYDEPAFSSPLRFLPLNGADDGARSTALPLVDTPTAFQTIHRIV